MPKELTKLEKFLSTDWDSQLTLLKDPDTASAVESWLGPDAFAELKDLSSGAKHMAGGDKNIIVVPGVMGSALQSEGEGGVWWLDLMFAREKLNQLRLASGGVQDIDQTYDVRPCAIDVSYGPLRQAIVKSGEFAGTNQFPYDWRKQLSASAGLLRELILKVAEDHGQPVHLVGHSMGGLMIRTTLMLHGKELWPKVGKIVFIATPHYGSPSIAGYLKNHLWGWEQVAVLAAFLDRETFRTLWGVLSLLPAPAGIYPGTRNGEPHPCANFNMYRAEEWQLGLDDTANKELQAALDAAAGFHRDLYAWHTGVLTKDQRAKMLQICGVGYKTLFRLEVKEGWLGLWEDVNKITSRVEGDHNRDGDGRVPLASAELEKIELRYVKGSHGSVQNIPAVAQDVLAWIAGTQLSLPDTPAGALKRHLAAAEASAAPNLDGSADIGTKDDEYDRYRDLSKERVEELIEDFKAGRLPNINQVRIL
jgi:pimeloyl-ACP methyl ester carboxylesterase